MFLFSSSSHDFLTTSESFLCKCLYLHASEGGYQFYKELRVWRRQKLCKRLLEIFWPASFFYRNIIKIGNLPTAFTNFDVLLLITHCPNGLLLNFSGCPWLLLTILDKFLSWRHLAADKLTKKIKKDFFRGQVYVFLLFWAHARWIVY